MPMVKNVEKKIWDVEGFAVCILHPDGRDVRGDKQKLPQYPFERAAKNDWTVEAWKESRFRPHYPGFDVLVLDADGERCQGNMKLGTVRDTYFED